MVGDVLTFYQERIANEGFLRTAIERRSILELGRLVGYRLKPGVSSSVYLAYSVDATAKTIIPAGSKAQSIPGADELPQMFETSEDLEARGVWNALKPRLSKPQEITLDTVLSLEEVWIKGTTTRIAAGDPLLFVFTRRRAGVRHAPCGEGHHRHGEGSRQHRPRSGASVLPRLYAHWRSRSWRASRCSPEDDAIVVNAEAPKKKKKKAEAGRERAGVRADAPPRRTVLEWILEQVLLGAGRTRRRRRRWLEEDDPVKEWIQQTETEVAATPALQPWKVSTLVKNLVVRRAGAAQQVAVRAQPPRVAPFELRLSAAPGEHIPATARRHAARGAGVVDVGRRSVRGVPEPACAPPPGFRLRLQRPHADLRGASVRGRRHAGSGSTPTKTTWR